MSIGQQKQTTKCADGDEIRKKKRQAHYYNRSVKDLLALIKGDVVRVQLFQGRLWEKATVVKQKGSHSYVVWRTDGSTNWRNQKHLRALRESQRESEEEEVRDFEQFQESEEEEGDSQQLNYLRPSAETLVRSRAREEEPAPTTIETGSSIQTDKDHT